MASGSFLTTKLMRSDSQTPWGFRLQGGQEFLMPLSVVKVTSGSLAEQTGMQVGDILLKINGKETEHMRHKEAQDAIVGAGNYLELYLERGPMNRWQPTVVPIGDPAGKDQFGQNQLYTKTSLSKSPETYHPIGSGHNSTAKAFIGQSNPGGLVHMQYNSPVNLYSEKNIAETLNAHSQVLATGATGINFIKPDAPINKDSAVYQMVHDEEKRKSQGLSASPDQRSKSQESVIKHVDAPSGTPVAQANAPQKNICSECERLILGLMVRINNKLLHPECFRCATCGTSLKQVGYFSVNDKLYCDIHARQVKNFLGGFNNPINITSSAPVGNNYPSQNGFHSTQPPFASGGYSQPIAPPQSIPVSYQPPNPTQNGLQSYSSPKKYAPISPPTASKPNFNANRNSMYVNQPPFAQTQSTVRSSNSKFSWPPNAAGAAVPPASNMVQYRQTSHFTERPKSCYSSLPGSAYSVTTNTYQTTTTTNYPSDTNQYPKTATYASSTQTTSIPPVVKPLPQYNTPALDAAAPGGTLNTHPFPGASTTSFGKLSDSKSVPRRDIFVASNFAPGCAKCNQRIQGDCLNALDRQWHPNCFICFSCKKPFGNSSFYMEDGNPYCEKDWNNMFTTKCVGCTYPIAAGDRWVEALNQNFHTNCFRCTVCGGTLEGQSFFAKGGRPYCKAHAR